MKQSSYTRICTNQWGTHGQFIPQNITLCSATGPKKRGFSPCKAQASGSGPWALIATSFSAQNKSIKLQIPSLLQRGNKLLPHVLFPYPAAILEFRLCTLSNFSHCENKGIKAIRGQGGKQKRGGGQQRAGGAGCAVPRPGGVWGCGGCVYVWEGDPQYRAWVWVSIHTGSRTIAALHPASGGSCGLTVSEGIHLTPLFPEFHLRHAPDIRQGSWEHANTGKRHLVQWLPPISPFLYCRGFKIGCLFWNAGTESFKMEINRLFMNYLIRETWHCSVRFGFVE